MIWVLYGCLAALAVAGILVLVRLERGPGNLDRVVALDVTTAVLVGMIVMIMAISGRIDLLPLLVILTSVGFIGSTVVARFSQAESIGGKRTPTRAEALRQPDPVPDDAAAPGHLGADEGRDGPSAAGPASGDQVGGRR